MKKLSKTFQNKFNGVQKQLDKAPKMSDEDVKKNLNIPARDEEKYPMPSQQDIVTASSLIYKINLMGSQVDQNLGALLGQLYIDIYNHVNSEVQDPNAVISTLDKLREYVRTCNNPIFDIKVVPGESDNNAQQDNENKASEASV